MADWRRRNQGSARMSVYEELLDWQRRTKIEAGGNIP
jgi:hypothetical protein